MTVRERITQIQKRLRESAVTPELARESLMLLTSLNGNCAEEYREAELAFKRVLRDALNTHEAANRARIEAECSEEYKRLRIAKDTQELTKSMIISCRAFLRSIDEEMRLSR